MTWLARLVARHPWKVLLLWLIMFLLCAPLAARTPGGLSEGNSGLVLRHLDYWGLMTCQMFVMVGT